MQIHGFEDLRQLSGKKHGISLCNLPMIQRDGLWRKLRPSLRSSSSNALDWKILGLVHSFSRWDNLEGSFLNRVIFCVFFS